MSRSHNLINSLVCPKDYMPYMFDETLPNCSRDFITEKRCHCAHRITLNTEELQWLKHLWNHENMFETGVAQANECSS